MGAAGPKRRQAKELRNGGGEGMGEKKTERPRGVLKCGQRWTKNDSGEERNDGRKELN